MCTELVKIQCRILLVRAGLQKNTSQIYILSSASDLLFNNTSAIFGIMGVDVNTYKDGDCKLNRL